MSRKKPGRARIEETLLELLGRKKLNEISVVELCKAAQVSRSTFYMYYSNVADVYRTCVDKLVSVTSLVRSQIKTNDMSEGVVGRPLCRTIREDAKYKGLVAEDQFIPTYLDLCTSRFRGSEMDVFKDICPQESVASALQCFQLMGCIMAARAIPSSEDWTPIKNALDAFIKGGLDAVRGKTF